MEYAQSLVSMPPDTNTAPAPPPPPPPAEEEEEEEAAAAVAGQTARVKMSWEWGRCDVLYTHCASLGRRPAPTEASCAVRVAAASFVVAEEKGSDDGCATLRTHVTRQSTPDAKI